MKWRNSSIFGIFTVSDTVNRAVIKSQGTGISPGYFQRKIEEK